jgi:hypothetical protein
MAIIQTVCVSFKKELLLGLHDFTLTTGSTFKIALYTSTANLTEDTTVYSTTNEVVGTGYTAGGATLTNVTPTVSGSVGVSSFNTVTWSSTSITARGALVYNSSAADRAVVVLDFGENKTTSTADFVISFPIVDAANAVIRVI